MHECALCKMQVDFGLTRPLTKSSCEMYGLKESDLLPDMRVCSSCRCKSIQRRYWFIMFVYSRVFLYLRHASQWSNHVKVTLKRLCHIKSNGIQIWGWFSIYVNCSGTNVSRRCWISETYFGPVENFLVDTLRKYSCKFFFLLKSVFLCFIKAGAQFRRASRLVVKQSCCVHCRRSFKTCRWTWRIEYCLKCVSFSILHAGNFLSLCSMYRTLTYLYGYARF